MPYTLTQIRVFRAPPERVWRALTEPAGIVKWNPPNGFVAEAHELDLRVGGRYRMSFINLGNGQLDFRMGDLAIDPDGQAWRDTYARSQELERIAELAQALAARKRAQDEVLTLIRRWERAIQAGDLDGILAHHTEDVVMFDVPEPLQSLGLAAYRQTWELCFRYGSSGPDVFVIEDLHVTAGSDVAFATRLLRIGGSPSPVCRLTLGLVKRDGQWLMAHERHSAPHALEDQEAHS